MMYFMNDSQELIGKTIAYIDIESDCECVIGTTDGGILSFYDSSETPPEINKGKQAEYFILNRPSLVENLVKSGMPIKEDYEKLRYEHKLKLEKEENERIERQKEKEYNEYMRLKEKFEK